MHFIHAPVIVLCFFNYCLDIDGAYFGSTFPNLFLMTYGHLKPQKMSQSYVPRVFGFKIHKPWCWGTKLPLGQLIGVGVPFINWNSLPFWGGNDLTMQFWVHSSPKLSHTKVPLSKIWCEKDSLLYMQNYFIFSLGACFYLSVVFFVLSRFIMYF